MFGRRGLFIAILMLLGVWSFSAVAQEDGFDLPTELYVLLNEGRVQRYGLGAAGVASITPEDAVVVDFGIAPDGIWLAYRTEAGLTLHNLLTDESNPLEAQSAGLPPYRGRGQTLAWSPDGAIVAYTTDYGLRAHFVGGGFFDVVTTPLLNLMWSPNGQFLAAEAEQNIWWVYRLEGDTLVLTSAIPSSVGLAWVGDGLLMFSPAEGGLFLMDVSNRNLQSELSDTKTVFGLPVYRRDGTVAIFGRAANDTTLTENVGYLYQVVPSADAVSVERVSDTPVDFSQLQWAPGGGVMLALRGGILALIDAVSGQGFTLPVTGVTTYGWGGLRPPSVANLPLSQAAYLLAADSAGMGQVWRVGEDGIAAPVLFTEDTIGLFAASAHTGHVAYYADGTLWSLPPEAETATALLAMEPPSDLTFTPDGTMLAYSIDDQIYTLPVSGGQPELLLTGYRAPQYSPNGEALLARLSDGDLAVYTLATGDVRRLGGYAWAKWQPDGAILAYGAPLADWQHGVYLIGSNFEPSLIYTVSDGLIVADAAYTGNGDLLLLQMRAVDAPARLSVVRVPTGGGDAVAVGDVGFIGQPSLSADGRFVMGYAGASGSVVFYDLNQAQERVLTFPTQIDQFTWG